MFLLELSAKSQLVKPAGFFLELCTESQLSCGNLKVSFHKPYKYIDGFFLELCQIVMNSITAEDSSKFPAPPR